MEQNLTRVVLCGCVCIYYHRLYIHLPMILHIYSSALYRNPQVVLYGQTAFLRRALSLAVYCKR